MGSKKEKEFLPLSGSAFSDFGIFRNETSVDTSIKEDYHDRVIGLIDMNCYYCQVCEHNMPHLVGKPFGVYQKYLIVSSNYVARGLGVPKMTRIEKAQEICPSLELVCGEDLTPFRKASNEIFKVIQSHCSVAEKQGLDEVFIDITDIVNDRIIKYSADELREEGHSRPEFIDSVLAKTKSHVYNSASGWKEYTADVFSLPSCDVDGCGCQERLVMGCEVVHEIRMDLLSRLGFKTCGGIGWSKLTAKLAAGINKPEKQTLMLPTYFPGILKSMNLRAIPSVGYAVRKKLGLSGDDGVDKVRSLSFDMLKKALGEKVAGNVFRLVRGIDDSRVSPTSEIKTLSVEDSFRSCNTRENAFYRLEGLCHSLVKRIDAELESPKRYPRTFRLAVRPAGSGHFSRLSRQCAFPDAYLGKENLEDKVYLLTNLAYNLFKKVIPDKKFAIVVLNVSVSNLSTVPPTSISNQSITSFFKAHSGDENLHQANAENVSKGEYESEATVEQTNGAIIRAKGSLASSSSQDFPDSFICDVCGERLPLFCLSAHALFHSEGDT
eukprot:Nk52_evm12s162 gene=Nk52_evmTU12s162